jgi:hypothetical protein
VKTNAERSIEALTWAAVVMWLGFALVLHLLGYVWLVVMVLSIILLSSAIYQRSRGWHTSLMIWIAGVLMAGFSVLEVVNELVSALSGGEGLNIDLWVYMGLGLMAMGLAVVLRYFQGPSLPARSSSRQTSQQRQQATRAPRRVQEDMTSGYTAPRQATSQQSTRTPSQPQQPTRTPRANAPEDWESRVDDIIQRSRERRNRDNLPY